jgi:hypothetical protein
MTSMDYLKVVNETEKYLQKFNKLGTTNAFIRHYKEI